jgi:hypothetical protein
MGVSLAADHLLPLLLIAQALARSVIILESTRRDVRLGGVR